MNEYEEFLLVYQKFAKYKRKAILVPILILVGVTIIVITDMVPINPFILYMIAMGVAIYFEYKNRTESTNFNRLKKILKKYNPEVLKNEELLFFLDYQLMNSFKTDGTRLLKKFSSSPINEEFNEILLDMTTYHGEMSTKYHSEQSIESLLKK